MDDVLLKETDTNKWFYGFIWLIDSEIWGKQKVLSN